MNETTTTPHAPERRTLDVAEMRTEGKKLAGYAAVYDSLSSDLGGYRERIAPGAFSSVLASEPDVHLVLNHDDSQVLARTKSGTLTLTEDRRGLAFEATLPNSPLGDNVRESVRRGDIDGASFRFTVGSESWDDTGEQRTINRVAELYDVTVATRGAYPAAHVELRNQPKEKTIVDTPTQVVEEESTADINEDEIADEPAEERKAAPRRRGSLRVTDATAEAETRSIDDRFRDSILSVRKGEVRALSTSSTLAPGELSMYVFDKLRAQSVILKSGVKVLETQTDKVTYPRLTVDVAPGFVAEGAAITPGDPTLDSIQATPWKIADLVQFSNELIEDAPPPAPGGAGVGGSGSAALDVVYESMVTNLSLKLDLAAFEGTGSSQIKGLKNVSGINSASMGTNGAALTNLDPIADAIEAIEAANGHAGAIVMHPRTWNEVRKLKDSQNRYLLDVNQSVLGQYSIFDIPVYISSQLSITDTQGSASTASRIYVYDPSQVVLVRRTDAEIELDRSRLFNSDQSEMRGRLRADLIVPTAAAVSCIVGVL